MVEVVQPSGSDDSVDELAEAAAEAVAVAVTGQTVVVTAITSVVTCPIGQFVTVAAHDVIVYVVVE